jgi:hypothetical protein
VHSRLLHISRGRPLTSALHEVHLPALRGAITVITTLTLTLGTVLTGASGKRAMAAPTAVESSGQLHLITCGTNERIYRNTFTGTWTGTSEIAGTA